MTDDDCSTCETSRLRGLVPRAENCVWCGAEWHVVGRRATSPFTCMGDCEAS